MKVTTIDRKVSLARKAVGAALIAQAFTSTPLFAATSEDEIRELRSMIERLQKKLEGIEDSQKKATATPPTAAPAAGNLLPQGLTIYGALDSGVERVTNVGTSQENVSRIPSTTGTGPSVIGLDFKRNVTASISAVGKAEMGLLLDTGSSGQGGRLFGRQLFVGLDTPVGSLTAGRQYSMLFYSLHGSDILGPNIYGLASIDAYVPNARADNAVVWRAKFDKLSLGAHYSFGRDTVSNTVPASGSCGGEDATDTNRCRSWSAMAKYDQPTYGFAVAIDKLHGGTGAQASFLNGAPPIALTSASNMDRRVTANGYVRFGALKLGVGRLARKVDTATTTVEQDTTWVEGEYAITTQWIVDGGVFHVSNEDQDRKANLYSIRGTYKFDDQLSTYLTLGYMDNSSRAAYGVSGGGAGVAPSAGSSQLGTMVGVRYRF